MAEVIDLPPSIQQHFMGRIALESVNYASEIALANRRQADGAAFDMRALGGLLGVEFLVSNDTSEMTRTNAAVRIPTTLDHPGIPAVK